MPGARVERIGVVASMQARAPEQDAPVRSGEHSPAKGIEPAAAPAADRVLALQRTAGNRAVGRVLARWSPPPLPKPPPLPDPAEVAKEASEAAIAGFRSMGDGTEAEVKARTLSHASQVSWAMTGKSSGEAAARSARGTWAWVTGDETYKPARVQSTLGGAYLRMYLAGKVDPDTVAAAGEEMLASPEFAKLRAQVHAHLATLKPAADSAAAEAQIQKAAQAYLDRRLKYGGLAFRYELNAVIGGVGDVDVTKVDALVHSGEGGKRQVWYALHLTFRDAYDFDNARSGVYDVYRKKLAKLLIDGHYQDFWEAYGRETIGLGTTGLDSAAIFASFMYAVEKKGWTPGALAWDVTLPMTGTIP
jgi:hypothetical protein